MQCKELGNYHVWSYFHFWKKWGNILRNLILLAPSNWPWYWILIIQGTSTLNSEPLQEHIWRAEPLNCMETASLHLKIYQLGRYWNPRTPWQGPGIGLFGGNSSISSSLFTWYILNKEELQTLKAVEGSWEGENEFRDREPWTPRQAYLWLFWVYHWFSGCPQADPFDFFWISFSPAVHTDW